jgi:hypothetical protein
MSKKIYARYGFTDLIVDKESPVEKYVQIYAGTAQSPIRRNRNGKVIGESELSLIGFEDENGIECNEDGSEL